MTNYYPKNLIAKRLASKKKSQFDETSATHQYGQDVGNIRWSEDGNELFVEGFPYDIMKDQVKISFDGPGYSSIVSIPRALAAKLKI